MASSLMFKLMSGPLQTYNKQLAIFRHKRTVQDFFAELLKLGRPITHQAAHHHQPFCVLKHASPSMHYTTNLQISPTNMAEWDVYEFSVFRTW
jgi:hypothetical protein